MGGRGSSSASTGGVINSVHRQAITNLEKNGAKVESWDAIKTRDINKSVDSHVVAALVKSKNGGYTIRTAAFSALEDGSPYKQRSGFHQNRVLRGFSESMAKLEYEDFVDAMRRRVK